jgi:tetratricopeptide (TPR) repeat protein
MLPYKAFRFNFPAEVEVGRYSRIAKSADNQYLQILAETGFLGFLTFLVGWVSIYFVQRRFKDQFLALRSTYLVMSIFSLFSLPLNVTAILFLFLFLIVIPLAFEASARRIELRLNMFRKLLFTVIVVFLFVFLVFLPYLADREWKKALSSTNIQQIEKHLSNAVRYNPYQPYYRFVFIRALLDQDPSLDVEKARSLTETINASIRLNPLDPDFYAYRAKVSRKLFELFNRTTYYSQAVSSYQAALDRSPSNVFLRAEYALFLYQTNHLPLAEAELRKILDAEPAYLNARLLLAETEWRQGEYTSARSEYVRTEELERTYRGLQQSTREGYVKKLLRLDPRTKEVVRRLIFPDEPD